MPSFWYGSKSWANWVLKVAIHEINNVDRDLSARRIEVHHILKELDEKGFKWQAARLRNHINLAAKKRIFSFTDPPAGGSDISLRAEEAS
jgi:hypothetical protein